MEINGINSEDLVWSITGIKTRNIVSTTGTKLENAVSQVDWTAKYTNAEDKEASFSGTFLLNLDDMTDEEFIFLENLTEAVVIEWMQEHIDESVLKNVLTKMSRQFVETVVSSNELPWAEPQPTEETE